MVAEGYIDFDIIILNFISGELQFPTYKASRLDTNPVVVRSYKSNSTRQWRVMVN